MKVIIVENYEEASREGANIIIEQVKNKANSILGLATGTTPIGLYDLLIKDYKENHTSYKNVKTFNLDEYIGLADDHPQSYHYFMNEHLFNNIDIDPTNVHVPDGLGDIKEACDTYNKMLSENPIDLQLLGIGSNGHIGFNEPGTSFDSLTGCIDLKESTINDNARLFFNGNKDEVPTQAISMGIKNILDAKKIILMACGENKAKAIHALIEGKPTIDVPATALQNHDDVVIIIDKAAASLLTK